MKTPTTLIIMDGFGLRRGHPRQRRSGCQHPPAGLALLPSTPYCQLAASGLDVGLPEGQMGNSEVGHTNIGAGRVVFQDLPRISRAIEDGSFFENPAYLAAIRRLQGKRRCPASDGPAVRRRRPQPHRPFVRAPRAGQARRKCLRCTSTAFLDGRDVSPTSGLGFVQQLQDKMRELGVGQIADRSRAATTPWTGTAAGSASSGPMTPWRAAAPPLPRTPARPSRPLTTPGSPMNSSSPWSAPRAAASKKATASSS